MIVEHDLIQSGGRLLPTPRTTDTNGPGTHGTGGPDLRTAIRLLPTPVTTDAKGARNSTLQYPPNSETKIGDTLTDIVTTLAGDRQRIPRLLPTPQASDAQGGRTSKNPTTRRPSGAKKAVPLADAIRHNAWGDYHPAIHRWETILGRPAPNPTTPGRNNRPRLNPQLSEWLMGLPPGHITNPQIGLTHAQQLRTIGNGVVPHQAALALQHLDPQ